MDLVYYIDSVFQLSRSKCDLFLHITDVADTVITCGVHFNNVSCHAHIYASACRACVTGISILRVKAVDSLGEDLRAACLTRSSRSAEKVCVRYLIVGYFIF